MEGRSTAAHRRGCVFLAQKECTGAETFPDSRREHFISAYCPQMCRFLLPSKSDSCYRQNRVSPRPAEGSARQIPLVTEARRHLNTQEKQNNKVCF